MASIPPGAREIDPQAEAERLAEERVRRRDRLGYTLLLEDVQQVQRDSEPVFVHIIVTASERHPAPADLGRKIADVIRENWPVREPRDD